MSRRREIEPLMMAAQDNTRPFVPWSRGELERLFASARTMPGDVAGVEAGRWWFALLAVMLDTGLSAAELLAIDKAQYDPRTGTLVSRLFAFQLHPKAVEAVDAMRRHEHARLFPWPLDNGRPPFHMLLRTYKQVLFRANLPYAQPCLFQRLQRTGRALPDALGQLDLTLTINARSDKLRFVRPRDRERWQQLLAEDPSGQRKRRRRKATPPRTPDQAAVIVTIGNNSPKSLRRFFEDVYRPQRLADATEHTAGDYRSALNWLARFCGCEPSLDCLSDDLLERFLAWLKAAGKANATVNGQRACLLALWRHAWRKRLVPEQPRDVMKLRVPKRLPEAWSPEQVGLILRAAAESPGTICGIPAAAWWPALVLTLYDTGLRIAAVMQLRQADLTADGWLNVPAEVQKQDADQAFRLHPDTLRSIAATLAEPREWLFPWPIDSDGHFRYLARAYREILQRAGLSHGRRDLFHKLRRTSATAIADAYDLATAQRHLGHSGIDVTRRYVDPTKLKRNHTGAEAIQRPAWPGLAAGDVADNG